MPRVEGFSSSIKEAMEKLKPKVKETLWKGPSDPGKNGGITFSMLSNFLNCRERFRIKYVLGLKPTATFNHRIEYGNLWHVCEEFHAQGQAWEGPLASYAADLCKRYPMSREQIMHWRDVCAVQFPIYLDWWSKHPDTRSREPLMSEEVFDLPYELPNGRKVRLRGKFDSVDVVKDRMQKRAWLQENKTKGDVDEINLQRQLSFDLQTMMYLTALELLLKNTRRRPDSVLPLRMPIGGARYNVVRRPLSGGKGSIVRHKATKNKPEETRESFYGRLRDIIAEDPSAFFMRWNVMVTPGDVEKFRRTCLDPLLTQLCQWWDWIEQCHRLNDDPFSTGNGIHWRHPFGVYNSLDEGGSTDLDEHLSSGSEIGLDRVDRLFTELA